MTKSKKKLLEEIKDLQQRIIEETRKGFKREMKMVPEFTHQELNDYHVELGIDLHNIINYHNGDFE